MNAAMPVSAAPFRTVRRETSGVNLSFMCSSLGGDRWLRSPRLHDERMVGRPREMDRVATGPQLLAGGSLDVLLIDLDPGSTPGLDEVLGAHADVRRVDHGAVEVVVPRRRRRALPVEADLLGPHAAAHVVPAVHEVGTRLDRGSVAQPDRPEGAVRA